MLKQILIKITMFFILVMIFFGYAINNQIALSLIIITLSSLSILTLGYLKMGKSEYFLLFFVITSMFSVIYSIDATDSMNFVFTLITIFIVQVFLKSNTTHSNYLINTMYLMSGIHVFFTIIQPVSPSLVDTISQVLLNSSDYATSHFLTSLGSITGITNQTGTNALYLSIFTGISFIRILERNHTITSFLLFSSGIYALFVTYKRSLLIASIIGFIGVLMINNPSIREKNKGKGKNTIIPYALLALFGVIILNSSFLQEYINYISRKGGDDFTNGRIILYKNTFEYFLEKPLLGNGVYTMYSELAGGTHNIYIQILAELGLIGLILFLIYIISNITKSFKIHIKQPTTNTKLSIYFQVVFLIYGMTGNPIYNLSFFLLYIVLISIIPDLSKNPVEEAVSLDNTGVLSWN